MNTVSGCFGPRHGCGRIPASRRRYWVNKIDGNAARDRRNAAPAGAFSPSGNVKPEKHTSTRSNAGSQIS
jgi:hypothetical protein